MISSGSVDGLSLAMSSTDGYCSFANFAPGELGVPLEENGNSLLPFITCSYFGQKYQLP